MAIICLSKIVALVKNLKYNRGNKHNKTKEILNYHQLAQQIVVIRTSLASILTKMVM